MKKLLFFLFLLVTLLANAQKKKITELPTFSGNGDSTIVAVVESGITKQVLAKNLSRSKIDSIWISGGFIYYRRWGTVYQAGAVGSGGSPVPTNLTGSTSAFQFQIGNDNGTGVTVPAVTTGVAGVMTPAMLNRLFSNTTITNATGSGDSLVVSVSDSALKVKRLEFVAGTNVTLSKTVTSDKVSVTINAAGGGSGLFTEIVPLTTVTNQPYVVIPISGSYKRVEVEILSLIPVTATNIRMEYSNDGSTWISSGYNFHKRTQDNSNGGTAGTGGYVELVDWLSNDATSPMTGVITVRDGYPGFMRPTVSWDLDAVYGNGNSAMLEGTSRIATAVPIQAIRLYMASGDIANCRYRVIGY